MAKASKKAATKSTAAKKAPAKKTAAKTASKATTKASSKTTTKKAPAKKSARKPNAAFMAPLQPDETLAAVIGNKAIPRTEIVKKVWDYIKKNDLQDKTNKRMINADEKTRPLFGASQISMFDLARIVNNHVKK